MIEIIPNISSILIELLEKLIRYFKDDLIVSSVYLRNNKRSVLKLKVSNNKEFNQKVNDIRIESLNGKNPITQYGSINPKDISPKDFEYFTIEFDGSIKNGKNKIELTINKSDYNEDKLIDKEVYPEYKDNVM